MRERTSPCRLHFQTVSSRIFEPRSNWRKALRVSPTMAAGVTDRLWEMVDVVDMLDTFEANRKRRTKPIFEVEQNGPSVALIMVAQRCRMALLIGSKALRRKAGTLDQER